MIECIYASCTMVILTSGLVCLFWKDGKDREHVPTWSEFHEAMSLTGCGRKRTRTKLGHALMVMMQVK